MKITCHREQFLAAFQTVAMVAPKNSPKPILQNVKLEVTETSAMLMATDTEIGIRMHVEGIDAQAPGSTLLPVVRFGSILRESTDERLRLQVDVQGTTIRGDRSQFKLTGGNPEEFPNVASFDEKSYQEIPSPLFRELVKRTLFATDNESSRYALGGVLLEMEEDKIVAVGTDGRRLAKMQGVSKSVGDHHLREQMTIVPTRSMQLIDRALTDSDASVLIAGRDNDILVKSGDATIFSRLIEGRFPKWRDVFPTRTESITIDCTVGPLLSAIRQAAIVASDETRGVDFTFGEGSLVLTSSTAEVGESRVELPIGFDGEPVTVTLDNRYVSDFLRVLDSETVIHIDIEDADKAALFTTDDGYGYVVMPLTRDR